MENLRRSYEISVWTLQDSFITVLKPSNLEFKGQIVDPLMNIKDDGENKLSLKIPMYVRNDGGEMIENPLWCNTRNGTIIVDLRKLKVIFNKATTSEEVFEFLITNMQEEHEGFKKYCEVECEGLAFHELGKQGYKIALEGGDEIAIEQKKYFDGESEYAACPQPTINYWADRVFKNSNWRYSVQMDWSAHDGITHQEYDIPAAGRILNSDNYASFSEKEKDLFNKQRALSGLRRRDRVYEDSFVSAWEYNEDTNKLTPKTITEEKEKYRLVEASESNRYNLSQTIAETFQVYCKYKYYYDDNYHIIDREVIFYNNFLNESQGVIDLTYKYNTEHLSRVMDATDTVSKMYVRPLKDGDAPTGEALISDAAANKSKEDYLLNFDYLYNIGTITQEQYDEIEPYYLKLRKINERLIQINEDLITKEREKIKQEARKQTAEDSIAVDTENISNNDAIARSIGDESGNIHVTMDNPQTLFLIPENNKQTYYCNFKSQGVIRNTIHLYWDKNVASEITQYNVENDEFGEVSKVVNINKSGHENQSWVYAIFEYSPDTYYKKVSAIYGIRLGQDQAIAEDATQQIEDLEEAIAILTDEQSALLKQKTEIVNAFERMMGPALREGQWQPEDEYSDYGEVYEEEIELDNNSEFDDNLLSLGWDNELFDSEQDFHYQYGATLEDRYYPCIEINISMLNTFSPITKFLSQLTLIYKNATVGNEQRLKQYIAINSKMKIAFLRDITSKVVKPVLMITDAATMDEDQLELLQNTGYLAYISSNIDTGVISETVTYTNLNWVIKPTEITNNKNYEIVYPRFKINSLFVKSPYTMITVKRQEEINWEVLANYENFYILPRTSCYTVTIKPETIFLSTNPLNFPLNYKIYFTISMSPLVIYLDAIQVLKENAFPKVSYEIDVMSVNEEFVYSDYSRLGQIAHINDYEFRFENTMGYISELDLDLEKPWQDKAIIKNYKTKFEDIFSTIVAQSEQMKKNSATIAMAASAFNSDGTLSSSVLGESLLNEILTRAADNTTDNSVPSPATEYLKYDPLIRNQLRQTYNEAGEVLAAASKSIDAVNALTLQNADILGSFQTNIAENMTPTRFEDRKESESDTEFKRYNTTLNEFIKDFKVGDIWIRDDGATIYTAIQNSANVQYEDGEDALTSIKGWSKTKDGQLSIANISGAYLSIDTEKGEIEIAAEKQIQLICGGTIDLYSKDVVITGEQNVIIGGPDVTIYSTDTSGNNTRGVHIFASQYGASSSSKSAVDITGDGVVIGSAGKIDIKSAKGINIYSSDTSSTSVVRINREQGIYLGANQPIRLFSGTSVPSSMSISGASVEISNSRILFGVTNGQSGSAVDITKDYIIFGTGFINSSGTETTTDIGSKNGGAGVKITQTSIQMATGTASTTSRNYINMDSSGVIIANTSNEANGSYVKVSKDGVLIGANTSMQQQQLINDITGTHTISYSGARFQVYAPNFIVTDAGKLYAYNADISGTIRATAGTIGGWQIDTNSIHTANTAITSNINGSVGLSSSTFTRTINNTSRNGLKFAIGSNFGVTDTGKLYASNVEISGALTASSISNGNFTVTTGGYITAKSGTIGGWNISEKSLYSGTEGSGYLSSNVTLMSGTNTFSRLIGNSTKSSLKFAIGSHFGVDSNGYLYAYSAEISGALTASSLSSGGRTSWGEGQDGTYIANDGGIYVGSENKFKVTKKGEVTASSIQISGGSIKLYSDSGKEGVRIEEGKVEFFSQEGGGGDEIAIDHSGGLYMSEEGTVRFDSGNTETPLEVTGSLIVGGGKSRYLSVEQYGERLLYCYETPSPFFGDIGEGEIPFDGKCYIFFDPIFSQTISTYQYQVFLQKYGSGECYIAERKSSYFIVEGTPGLSFGWEIKGKQVDYSQLRLEKKITEKFKMPEQTYDIQAEKYLKELYQKRIEKTSLL